MVLWQAQERGLRVGRAVSDGGAAMAQGLRTAGPPVPLHRDVWHVLHQCGRDILMWSGIELLCLPLLALGGVGFVSAVANLAPAAVAQMFDLWTAGEQEKARELHFALHPLVDVIFTETNPAPAKWVLHQAGLLGSARVRPPLAAVSGAGQRRITDLLRAGAAALSPPVSDLAG